MGNHSFIIRWRHRLEESTVAKNTIAMTAGSGMRLLLQAVYFVLIARSLGAGQYGAFIGAVSLIAVLAPFALWGTEGLLVRNVARQKETFRQSWGNALWMTSVSGSILLITVMLVSRFILSDRTPLTLVFLVGFSDLILAGIVDLSGKAFLAFEMLGRTTQIGVVLTGLRAVFALAMFIWVPQPNATTWGFLYLCSTGVCAIYSCHAVFRQFGYPRSAFTNLKADLRDGFHFSLGLSSQSIYNNIDKIMLVRLATLEAAGVYSTAYRIIDLAMQPVSSLLYSTYSKFFQHGSRGIHGSSKYMKRLLPFGVGYSALVAVVLFIAAPVFPKILGRSFIGADDALRWLSPLILVRTVHYFLANSLTGADFQGLRSYIQVTIAAFNFLLNLWLIPAYSWRGAAWASLASDGLLLVGFWLAIEILQHQKKRAEFVQKIQPGLFPES